MQICIDATSLLVRSAGVKNYMWHWLRALDSEFPPGSIKKFPLIGSAGELNHERPPFGPAYTLPRLVLLKLANMGVPRLPELLAGNVDIFHASNLAQRLPRRPRITATIHDMTALLMPEFHTEATRKAE